MVSKYMIATNAQKVISFLLMNPNKPYFERDIARKTGISFGSANKLLNQLKKDGILQRKAEGRMNYYSIDILNPYIKEVKILNNLLLIEPLIEKLKPITYKIVLFGSWATGADDENSDIDLFIVSSKSSDVLAATNKFSEKISKKIQAILKTPAELMSANTKNDIFMKQVEQGKILWEKETNEDNF
ncbi:MAG: nucleotidyltransferase domain-containing protein [Elusimicrobia bacterium]|nr:nucleotidyltransferase domain-containing protein [Candidatus Liberimonas magnetica]